jgi:hypothetical protein
MKTLYVSNGDLDIPRNTGSLQYIDGINKAAQDVARHLLCEFSEFFQEGNELLELQIDPGSAGYMEGLVTQLISECINRLIAKQRNLDDDQRIVKINQIKTRLVGLTTVVFMVEVLFQDGQVASVINSISVKETQLNHLASVDASTLL